MQLKDYKLEDGGSCDVALLVSFVKAEGDQGLRAKKLLHVLSVNRKISGFDGGLVL